MEGAENEARSVNELQVMPCANSLHRHGNHDRTTSTGPPLASVPVTYPVLQDKPAVAVRALRPPCLRGNLQPDPGVSSFATITGHAVLGDLPDFRNLGYHAQSSVKAPDETLAWSRGFGNAVSLYPIRSPECRSRRDPECREGIRGELVPKKNRAQASAGRLAN